jgi:glycosyltransferase involved in cell wall biosynthesis
MTANYDVVIRTFNSAGTISTVLQSLTAQTSRPSALIFVDSGSDDDTLALLPPDAVVVPYTADPYNYSDSINAGLVHVQAEYTLILSSHTAIANPEALRFGIGVLQDDPKIAAVAFSDPAVLPDMSVSITNPENFTGWNGAHNTSSLYRTDLITRFPFRSDVFAAEDIEWSKRMMDTRGMFIAHCLGCGQRYLNPRKDSLRKRLNDHTAIAYFSVPSLRSPRNLARHLKHALVVALQGDFQEARFHALIAWQLAMTYLRKPRYPSRYYAAPPASRAKRDG